MTTDLLAVLASALPATPSGVVSAPKPETLDDLIELAEQTADAGIGACGLAQGRTQTSASR